MTSFTLLTPHPAANGPKRLPGLTGWQPPRQFFMHKTASTAPSDQKRGRYVGGSSNTKTLHRRAGITMTRHGWLPIATQSYNRHTPLERLALKNLNPKPPKNHDHHQATLRADDRCLRIRLHLRGWLGSGGRQHRDRGDSQAAFGGCALATGLSGQATGEPGHERCQHLAGADQLERVE